MLHKTLGRVLALGLAARGAVAEDNHDENFVLADCGFETVPGHPDWSASRQVLYYKGAVWTDGSMSATHQPDMVKEVPWDGSYPWRRKITEVTMPNNDQLWVQITHPEMPDGATVAGHILHGYGIHSLTCYPWHKPFVYKLPNNHWCSSAFVCNHKDRPISQAKTTVKVSTNSDSATLDTHVSVDHVFDNIKYDKKSQVCSEQWRDVAGTGCRIKARCHGNAEGVTKTMVDGLKAIARSKDAGMFTQTSVRDKKWDPCKSGRDTCVGGWAWYDRPATKVAQTLSVYVSDENGADKGELSYEFDCSRAKSCAGCSVANFGAAVARAMGLVFAPWVGGLASVVVSGACVASGC